MDCLSGMRSPHCQGEQQDSLKFTLDVLENFIVESIVMQQHFRSMKIRNSDWELPKSLKLN